MSAGGSSPENAGGTTPVINAIADINAIAHRVDDTVYEATRVEPEDGSRVKGKVGKKIAKKFRQIFTLKKKSSDVSSSTSRSYHASTSSSSQDTAAETTYTGSGGRPSNPSLGSTQFVCGDNTPDASRSTPASVSRTLEERTPNGLSINEIANAFHLSNHERTSEMERITEEHLAVVRSIENSRIAEGRPSNVPNEVGDDAEDSNVPPLPHWRPEGRDSSGLRRDQSESINEMPPINVVSNHDGRSVVSEITLDPHVVDPGPRWHPTVEGENQTNEEEHELQSAILNTDDDAPPVPDIVDDLEARIQRKNRENSSEGPRLPHSASAFDDPDSDEEDYLSMDEDAREDARAAAEDRLARILRRKNRRNTSEGRPKHGQDEGSAASDKVQKLIYGADANGWERVLLIDDVYGNMYQWVNSNVDYRTSVRKIHRSSVVLVPLNEGLVPPTAQGDGGDVVLEHSEIASTTEKNIDEKRSWLKSKLDHKSDKPVCVSVNSERGLLIEAMFEILPLSREDLRRQWLFKVDGETVTACRFFALASAELFSPELGMWTSDSSGFYTINPSSGLIFAKMILSEEKMKYRLHSQMLRHLVGWPVALYDPDQLALEGDGMECHKDLELMLNGGHGESVISSDIKITESMMEETKAGAKEYLKSLDNEMNWLLVEVDPSELSRLVSLFSWPVRRGETRPLPSPGVRMDGRLGNNWLTCQVVAGPTASDDTIQVHFDGTTNRHDASLTIEDFTLGRVYPLYTRVGRCSGLTEFTVYFRGADQSKSTYLFGHPFQVQCHTEWSLARATANILRMSLEHFSLHHFKTRERGGPFLKTDLTLTKALSESLAMALLDVDNSNLRLKLSNPSMNRRQIIPEAIRKQLEMLPFEIRVVRSNAPLGTGPKEAEANFPCELSRTVGNYFTPQMAIALHWRDDRDFEEDERQQVSQAELIRAEGDEAMSSGDMSEAISLYTRALELKPDDFQALCSRSDSFLKSGNPKEAKKDQMQVILMKPLSAKDFYLKGAAMCSADQHRRAESLFKEGLTQFPGDQDLLYGLENLCLSEEFEDALSILSDTQQHEDHSQADFDDAMQSRASRDVPITDDDRMKSPDSLDARISTQDEQGHRSDLNSRRSIESSNIPSASPASPMQSNIVSSERSNEPRLANDDDVNRSSSQCDGNAVDDGAQTPNQFNDDDEDLDVFERLALETTGARRHQVLESINEGEASGDIAEEQCRIGLVSVLEKLSVDPVTLSPQYVSSLRSKPETVLGGGFYGKVVLGVDQAINHQFAIKLVNPLAIEEKFSGRLKSIQKSFQNEIQILSRLSHPNIAKLYGYCMGDGLEDACLLYEYAQNGSLDRFWASRLGRARLSDAKIRCQIALEVALVLKYMHEGVGENTKCFHRDIKSGNVCLTTDFRVRVIDCGLGKYVTEQLGRFSSGGPSGTPGYTCPHYLMGGCAYESACDVFSFGVLLCDLITGSSSSHKSQHYFRYKTKTIKGGPTCLVENADECADWEGISLECLVDLALRCMESIPADRPDVVDVLWIGSVRDIAMRTTRELIYNDGCPKDKFAFEQIMMPVMENRLRQLSELQVKLCAGNGLPCGRTVTDKARITIKYSTEWLRSIAPALKASLEKIDLKIDVLPDDRETFHEWVEQLLDDNQRRLFEELKSNTGDRSANTSALQTLVGNALSYVAERAAATNITWQSEMTPVLDHVTNEPTFVLNEYASDPAYTSPL
ncbi:hypothetical protein THAOC_25776 [Thalassiosira oceanica]|uniref:Protein kinase domain-containing protein n=1 Tax=Thalassiosira oceanica TaxID=159749 RepID=K0S0I3_THAOC|nr:hypothetical protein THAOC_25776 [Thalassiosira oceanica]|eukprot:EJK54581.1 hypothetical protein THAOC_25776 [Thalassiosira oceanica]